MSISQFFLSSSTSTLGEYDSIATRNLIPSGNLAVLSSIGGISASSPGDAFVTDAIKLQLSFVTGGGVAVCSLLKQGASLITGVKNHNYLRVTRNASGDINYLRVAFMLNNSSVKLIKTKTVTVNFIIRSTITTTNAFVLRLVDQSANVYTKTFTVTSTFAQYSLTFSLQGSGITESATSYPVYYTTFTQLSIGYNAAIAPTVLSSDSFDVGAINITLGSTPLYPVIDQYLSTSGEYDEANQYYSKTFEQKTAPATNVLNGHYRWKLPAFSGVNADNLVHPITLPEKTLTNVTIVSYYSPGGASGGCYNFTALTTPTITTYFRNEAHLVANITALVPSGGDSIGTHTVSKVN